MYQLLSSKFVYRCLRLVLGAVFLYAGITKGLDTDAFAMAIDNYGLTSWRMSNFLAVTLPVLEIVSGLGLIADIRGALLVITAQLLGFMAVIAYAIHLGLNVDCGCFGPSEAGHSGNLTLTLVRDMIMFMMCLIIYRQRHVAGFTPRLKSRLSGRNPME